MEGRPGGRSRSRSVASGSAPTMMVATRHAMGRSDAAEGAITQKHKTRARYCIDKALERLQQQQQQQHQQQPPSQKPTNGHDSPPSMLAGGAVVWRPEVRKVPAALGESCIVWYLSLRNLAALGVAPDALLARANHIAASVTEGAGGEFRIGETRLCQVAAEELVGNDNDAMLRSGAMHLHVDLPMLELIFVPWTSLVGRFVALPPLRRLALLGLAALALFLALYVFWALAALAGRVAAFFALAVASLAAYQLYRLMTRPRTGEALMSEAERLAARAVYTELRHGHH